MIDQKQYLISFLATIKGTKFTRTELKKIKGELTRIGVIAPKLTKKTDDYTRALKRVAVVVPMWMAFRVVLMGIIKTFKDMVKANLDLEEGMARIQTVMQGTGSEVNASMAGIKKQRQTKG